MNQTTLFGLFLSMALGVAGAFTAGATQVTLFVAAGCAIVAMGLSAFVDQQGNRAREKILKGGR